MNQLVDCEKVKQLARRATRSAQFRFGSLDETMRDFDDMQQEAAATIWKALREGKSDAYAFTAGRHAASDWQRQWRGIKCHHKGTRTPPTFHAQSIEDAGWDYQQEEPREGYILSDELVEELFEMLLNSRRAKGKKEIDGAVKAATIVRLLAAGYNNVGIARELQMTQCTVRYYRKQIRDTLRTIAAAGGAG